MSRRQLGATPAVPASAVNLGYLDARTLSGTYAARPAATAVPANTFYYCTNIPETYLSNGSAWRVVGSGGNELAYAERTSTQSIAAGSAGTASVDIAGVTIGFVMPERPVVLEFGGLAQLVGTGNTPVLQCVETTGTATTVAEAFHMNSVNTSEFSQVVAQRRITGTAGQSRTFKLAASRDNRAAYAYLASTTYPIWLKASTI